MRIQKTKRLVPRRHFRDSHVRAPPALHCSFQSARRTLIFVFELYPLRCGKWNRFKLLGRIGGGTTLVVDESVYHIL